MGDDTTLDSRACPLDVRKFLAWLCLHIRGVEYQKSISQGPDQPSLQRKTIDMQRNLFLVFSLGSAMFLEYSSQLPQSLITYMGICLSSTVFCASET